MGGNVDGRIATVRWVALPEAGKHLREFSSRNETVVSVAVCWLAHLMHLIACMLDLPLRYPVKLMGSTSAILDVTSRKVEEYPLHVGKSNSDWNKFEFGVYLLSKNVSQLRWYFNLSTKDPKPMVLNVSQILNMGKSDAQIDRILMMLPTAPHLIPMPSVIEQLHPSSLDSMSVTSATTSDTSSSVPTSKSSTPSKMDEEDVLSSRKNNNNNVHSLGSSTT